MKKLLILLTVLIGINLYAFELQKFWIVESPKDDISEMKKIVKPKFETGDRLNMVFELSNCAVKNNKASVTYTYELKSNTKSVFISDPELLEPGTQSFWYMIEHDLTTDAGFYECILTIRDNNSGSEQKRSVMFNLKKGKSKAFVKKADVKKEKISVSEKQPVQKKDNVYEPAQNTPASSPSENSLLSLDKTEYFPGEEIKATFKVLKSFTSSAWIGILPADCPHGSEKVNDENDISYKHLQYEKYKGGGTMSLTAPLKTGAYDVRLNDNDSNGREMAYVPFKVTVVSDKISLSADKDSYLPGEDISITFTVHPAFSSSAWIGIVPGDCPHGSEKVNDENDLAYKHLQYKKYNGGGTMVLKAPRKSGVYDVRMHNTDSDGYEVASATIKVK